MPGPLTLNPEPVILSVAAVILSAAAVILSAAAVILSAAKDLCITAVFWTLIIPGIAAAQVSGQSFQVIPYTRQATVGDTVQVRFRVRLDERDLLFDTVPQPLGALPPGVRVLSVDRLTRTPDRIFHGQARLAFYRPGRQPVPIFTLPFMRAVKGVQRASLASDSAFVEIGSLVPAGNPPLKDIRELEPDARTNAIPFLVAGVLVALLLARYLLRRRRTVSAPPLTPTIPPLVLPPNPYQEALQQLEQVEREHWPERAQVARHYEQVVDVLRGYLESTEEVPARERTTEEVLWALPPHLSADGLRDRLRDLLDEADLVKFARLAPDPDRAGIFLEQSRALLLDWHNRVTRSQVADALR